MFSLVQGHVITAVRKRIIVDNAAVIPLAAMGSFIGEAAIVLRVIDGDTIEVSIAGTATIVRLLNINTPETKCPYLFRELLGPEASAFLTRELPPGTKIRLQYDVQRKDNYGRTLAAVYKENILINAEIARKGFGHAQKYGHNSRFYQKVLDAQKEAESAKIGLFDPRNKQ